MTYHRMKDFHRKMIRTMNGGKLQRRFCFVLWVKFADEKVLVNLLRHREFDRFYCACIKCQL